MNKLKEDAALKPNLARELCAALARKIASFVGEEENRITEIPGVSLHRRTSPTPPCRTTYHAGVIVVAQGRKLVEAVVGFASPGVVGTARWAESGYARRVKRSRRPLLPVDGGDGRTATREWQQGVCPQPPGCIGAARLISHFR